MKAIMRVMVAAARTALMIIAAMSPVRAESNSSPEAQVVVVRATKACFSAVIRVTGSLIAREEAVVTLDTPGMRVVEVLAGEGDRVTAGQTLARLTRQSGE